MSARPAGATRPGSRASIRQGSIAASSSRYALDLRGPSWDGIEERLAEAAAVRVGDTAGYAGWAYLRFRELSYAEADLDRIAVQLESLAADGLETFAFFRHGDAPDAPAAAMRVAG